MKWMMSSVVVLVGAVLSGGVAAQSSATAAKDDKMGNMAMKDATHTGCIEAGSTKGTFTLMVAADMAMMKKDSTTKDTPTKDAMTPTTMSLTSASVDLSKHLGHKVSVTGSHDNATAPFAVKTLKMVAASCS